MQGLLGKKLGMTRVFNADGHQVPVTVIEVGPCVVVQRKTKANDGYDAVQIGFEEQKEQRLSKAERTRFQKCGSSAKRYLLEFGVEDGDDYKPGDTITADIFASSGYVDVVGTTKGRGFQGVVKRYRMAGGAMTHGGHSKRRVGSVGCREVPGRIHKNKRMPGQMGNVRVTQQNLKIVALRAAENVILVGGAVPGATGGMLIVNKALKKAAKR